MGSTTLTDQGNIGGEDIATDTYTFFPSIAVNKDDHMIVGFSASASSIFAGAYYAGRFSGDPAGTPNSSVVIKAGLAYYVRIFAASGGTRNRWGDYSGASVDPSDDESFWIFNEYAFTRNQKESFARKNVSGLPVSTLAKGLSTSLATSSIVP